MENEYTISGFGITFQPTTSEQWSYTGESGPQSYRQCKLCGRNATRLCGKCGNFFCNRHSCMCIQFPSHTPPVGHPPYWFPTYGFSTMKFIM